MSKSFEVWHFPVHGAERVDGSRVATFAGKSLFSLFVERGRLSADFVLERDGDEVGRKTPRSSNNRT